MKRPDLLPENNGWQVLDPTPQEKSDGVYCCGPAPVKAILNGNTDLKYDVPFVYAEVNADCIDWLVKADGSKVKIYSDTNKVGQNISTKSVGSDKRWNITDNYKHKEGTEEERAVFKYAMTRDYSKVDGSVDSDKSEDETTITTVNGPTDNTNAEGTNETNVNGPVVNGTEEITNHIIEIENVVTRGSLPTFPQITMRFQEVSKPLNGEDVKVNLVLQSEAAVSRPLSINISVKAISYNGTPLSSIHTELKEETLLPGADLSVPIVVPFSEYWQPMLDSDVMKISAVVSDKQDSNQVYLAESDVVLFDPPIDFTLLNQARVRREVCLEVNFLNPVKETLKNCTLTLSGSGLMKEAETVNLPDLQPKNRFRVRLYLVPLKMGLQTLLADFDCSLFRDIKGSMSIHVKDNLFSY